jgi:hypothetical protein
MTTEELDCWEGYSLFSGELSEEQNSRQIQRQLRDKPEVRSEVCNLCSVVTETFGVLSLFGVMHCCGYSKIGSVIMNCNYTWWISNKPNFQIQNPQVVALPDNMQQYVALFCNFPHCQMTIRTHSFMNLHNMSIIRWCWCPKRGTNEESSI